MRGAAIAAPAAVHRPHRRAGWRRALALALLLGGCGGGADGGPATGASTGADTGEGGEAVSPPPLADPVTPPAALLAVRGDPARIGEVPTVVLTESVASSGLQVAYTDAGQRTRIDPLDIARWWDELQSCLEIVAPAPLVLVVAGTVDPFFPDDDVLSDPFTGITASGGPGSDGTPLFQAHEGGFDRAGDEAGFPLRSIMSRFLWESADRPERDTPFLCARSVRAARP